MKPLQCTGFPPHCYIILDESTPHRITNQAIMICAIQDSRCREANFISAPKVYSTEDEYLRGGNASNLAICIKEEITSKLPNLDFSCIVFIR